MRECKRNLRLRAAAWATLVAAIIVGIVSLVLTNGQLDPIAVTITVSGAISTGVSGYLIGWHLFDPEKQHSAVNDMLWGWGVAGLAYPLFAVVFALAEQARNVVYFAQLGIDAPEPGYILLTFVVALLFAPILSGWFVVPVAGFIAILFGRPYRKKVT